MKNKKPKKVMISFRADPKIYKYLKSRSKEQGVTMTEILNFYLSVYIGKGR